MLITYMNDYGFQIVTEVEDIDTIIPDYNGGSTVREQLEVFTVGYECNSLELIAATNWANECTSSNMIGIAASSDKISTGDYSTVIFEGIGSINEYLRILSMEPIYDYYPVKNIREAVEYYNYKLNGAKLIKAKSE